MRYALASLLAVFATAAHAQSAAPSPTEFQALMQRCRTDRSASVQECGRAVSDVLGHAQLDVSKALGQISNGGNDPTAEYVPDCTFPEPGHVHCDVYYCGVKDQQSFCDLHFSFSAHY